MTGQYAKTLGITTSALAKCNSQKVYYNSFEPSIRQIDPSLELELCTLDLSPTVIIGKHYVFEIIFLQPEIPYIPHPPRFEISGNPDVPTGSVIAIDSLVYAHFINFLCYFQTQQKVKMLQALRKFQTCLDKKLNCIPLKSTAFNLLAQCYIMVGDITHALQMLRVSLTFVTKCTRNAASWILGVLVFHAINGRLQTRVLPTPWHIVSI
eukprot:GHVU01172215.1.p1 GENE.GHVU01172215.1~~GHVU01172215.1.p1  ORF type:complete len:209 (-),score=7.78 GHVU01172215.1:13-639(-)